MSVRQASLRRERLRLPLAPPAGHRLHVAVAHLREVLGGERRAEAAAAVEDDLGVGVGDRLLDVALDDALAEVPRALDAACGELALLADVDELERRRRARCRAATSSVETSVMRERTSSQSFRKRGE